jgi:rhodanese-related sulfurtransferase
MNKSTISSRIVSVVVAIAAVFGLTLGLSGCSSQTVDMSTVTAVIDVRTPAEFAEGHLEGAVNINIEDPTFADQVSTLAKDGTYVVYCRSGNRSAQAIDAMTSMGFTDLTNAGGYLDASNLTGLPLVQ